MKNFLKKKGITLSPKVYFIDALGSMAFGLFATLLVGTILNTIIFIKNNMAFSKRCNRSCNSSFNSLQS